MDQSVFRFWNNQNKKKEQNPTSRAHTQNVQKKQQPSNKRDDQEIRKIQNQIQVQKGQNAPRKRLKRKYEASDDEVVVPPNQEKNEVEQEEDDEQLSAFSRFGYVDSNEEMERNKKGKEKNNMDIKEMIKKQKQKPKKSTQKPAKINADQKRKIREQYHNEIKSKRKDSQDSFQKLKKLAGDSDFEDQDQELIRIKRLSLQTSKKKDQFQKDLQEAIRLSKMEIEGGKSEKKIPSQKMEVQNYQNLNNYVYDKNKKSKNEEENKKQQKSKAALQIKKLLAQPDIKKPTQPKQQQPTVPIKPTITQPPEIKPSISQPKLPPSQLAQIKQLISLNKPPGSPTAEIKSVPIIKPIVSAQSAKPQFKYTRKLPKVSRRPSTDNIGPFSGKTFVLTGEFPQDKQKIADLLLSLGGRVTTGVSRKTTYLLQGGRLQDGREVTDSTKTVKAKELGTEIIPYDDIQTFFMLHTDMTLSEHFGRTRLEQIQRVATILPINVQPQKKGVIINQLWTEKYKPDSLEDVLGQHKQVDQLRQWLKGWETVHIQGIKHEVRPAFNSAYPSGTMNSKAALISGEPGIGKTTAARLIAQEYGYQCVEFNASDVRNKLGVNQMETGGQGFGGFRPKKNLFILDEVDGMSGGDRGGITAMINLIKNSKVPIICICNDRQSDKIRSLAGHCFDIRFYKPDKRMITRRLLQILAQQGIKTDEASVTLIVESMNNDIRQILNYLNVYTKTHKQLVYLNTKADIGGYEKDQSVMINTFGAATTMMNRVQFSKMRIRDRLDLFFIDSDQMPLMIHQNLVASGKKTPLTMGDFRNFVKAVDSISQSDVLNRCIRSNQEWGLMPMLGFTGCIYPTEMFSYSVGYPKFPEWLGKNSSTKKIQRQIRQLKVALSRTITGTRSAVKYDYSQALLKIILNKLQDQLIEDVLDICELYNLEMVHVKEHLLDIQYNPKKLDLMANITTNVKSKLTRSYNKRFGKEGKMPKEKGAKAEAMGKYDPLLDEYVVEGEEEIVKEDSIASSTSLQKGDGKKAGKKTKKGK